MPSPQTSRREDGSVLDSSGENFDGQELVARKEDLRPSNTGWLIMPPPTALSHLPSIYQAYSSNQPISSNHGTLQAQIKLQREKIRALELAVEERRRTEQLRDQERRRTTQLRNQERHQRRLKQEQALSLQRDKQCWRDRQAREQSAILRHKTTEKALKAVNEAIRQSRLAQIERISELERQRDEQLCKERRLRDELGMQALLRHKAKKARDAEYRKPAKLREAEQKRAREDEQRRRDKQRRNEPAMQAYLCHEAKTQARKVQQKPFTQELIVAYDGPIPSFLDQEYQYMKQASTTFPEEISLSIQMSCMMAYQKAISDASRRLLCGLCRGSFQEEEVLGVKVAESDITFPSFTPGDAFLFTFDGTTTDDDQDGDGIDASRFAAGDKVAVQAWFGSYVFTNKSGKTMSGPSFRLLKLWKLQAGAPGSSSLNSSPVTKRKRIL